jgi:hypothetical protein
VLQNEPWMSQMQPYGGGRLIVLQSGSHTLAEIGCGDCRFFWGEMDGDGGGRWLVWGRIGELCGSDVTGIRLRGMWVSEGWFRPDAQSNTSEADAGHPPPSCRT